MKSDEQLLLVCDILLTPDAIRDTCLTSQAYNVSKYKSRNLRIDLLDL